MRGNYITYGFVASYDCLCSKAFFRAVKGYKTPSESKRPSDHEGEVA